MVCHSKIPREFHRPVDPHPCKPDDEAEVPVIDMSDLDSAESKQRTIQSICKASEGWGFFQLLGHGIPSSLSDEFMSLAYKFFDQPLEDKLIFSSSSVLDQYGFMTNFDSNSRKPQATWQEFFFQSCIPACEHNKLPTHPPRFQKVSTLYGDEVTGLAKRLLELFSESLGLEAGDLHKKFEGDTMSMRINHYPPCPEPELAIGIQPHSDINLFTILQQDVEGLQVLHDGAWVNLKPLPGALVVNIGDQLQILSNDRFKSVEHRGVVNADRARVSIASFYGPAPASRIGPVPQLVTETNPAKFKEIVYWEYASESLKNDLYRKNALSTIRI